MNKNIKIQNSLDIPLSYNVANIEKVWKCKTKQHVKYETVDEYTLPVGCYANVLNFKSILFDEATKVMSETSGSGSGHGMQECVNKIILSSSTPTCEDMSNYYDTYNGTMYDDNTYINGVVVVDTSKEIYNEIKFDIEQILPDIADSGSGSGDAKYRIINIRLEGEYKTLDEAETYIESNTPVVLDFNSVYTKCAKYWKEISSMKTSAFSDTSINQDIIPDMRGFTTGFGIAKYRQGHSMGSESGSGSYSGSDSGGGGGTYYEYLGNVEKWKNNFPNGNSQFISPCGQYYPDEEGREIYDNHYNIFDVLFRYLYDYMYDSSEQTMPVKYPVTKKFLFKGYKTYIKNQSDESISTNLINSTSSYSVETLSLDEIKSLTFDEAQEYFNNTLIHNIPQYRNKLILQDFEACSVALQSGISDCCKLFILSDYVGIQVPSSISHTYYNLGNFELKRSTKDNHGNVITYTYKYANTGETVKVREVYDPLKNESYVISQNNAGGFIEEYTIDRYAVGIRGISGKEDYYYFYDNTDGNTYAEQLKEDVIYGIEEGPDTILCENLVAINH